MKLSVNWLNRFLDISEDEINVLCSKLTMNAFEIEGIEVFGANLNGPIVVGQILEIEKHPSADKLSVTQITTDGKNKFQIVCGAKNIKLGQKVPVSLLGAVVVNRKDGSTLEIKEASLRGVHSQGMLCSGNELGIQCVEDGIHILPEDAPLGQSIPDYLSISKDYVLEVGMRSNRGDALSVYGLAKEVSALTGKNIKKSEITFCEAPIDKSVKSICPKIENTNDTYIFYTCTIENIKIKESPDWLKNLLSSVGLKSINNIVDITNYINLSYGQPMHAYDKEKISGELISRNATESESILTLDGKPRKLRDGILVIADIKGPVSIAGIMGGKDSEVTNQTTAIVFEAAVFNPAKIRKGSRAIGLNTEASKRFERNVDSNLTYKALLKAIELTLLLAGGDEKIKVGEILKAGETIDKKIEITLNRDSLTKILEINLSFQEISRLLTPLEFICRELNTAEILISVPTSRQNDVTREIDVIEELARLYGYDKIIPTSPKSSTSSGLLSSTQNKIKSHFIHSGFNEVYLSSLIGDKLLGIKDFPFNEDQSIRMLNPLSSEHYVLRQSLLPGLIESVKLNQNYQNYILRLFEVGKVFFRDPSISLSNNNTGVTEVTTISGVMSSSQDNWYEGKFGKCNQYEKAFFTLKGILEGLTSFGFQPFDVSYLHPKYSLKVFLNDVEVGLIGCLHPRLEKSLEIKGPVAIYELNIDPIISQINKISANKAFSQISTQPHVERDITVDVSRTEESQKILNEINKISSNFVKKVNLISVYDQNEEVRSLSFRLYMQDVEQTLTSEQIDKEIEKIISHLSNKFHITIKTI